MLCTNLFISLLVSILSIVKTIHPPDRCGISRSWLNSMIITQPLLGTIKGRTKMCSFVTQRHRCLKLWGSVQLTCWLQECPPELLPENWMFISLPKNRLQRLFREFGSTSNRPHNCSPPGWCRVGEWFSDVNVVNRVVAMWWWNGLWAMGMGL